MEKASRYPWEFDGEKLSIETPEQTRLEYHVAPFGTRILAAAWDRMMILLITLGLWLAALLFFAAARSGEWGVYLLAIVWIAQFLLGTLYFVFVELRWEGRTWGKKRRKIRTVMGTGQGITFGASLIRNLARILDEFPLMWIVPALTQGNRRLGDLLAGTFVISEDLPALQRPTASWIDSLAPSYAALVERRFDFGPDPHSKLFADDLNLLEYIELRLEAVPHPRRRTLLLEVALRYMERLDIPGEREKIESQPKRFLQELALLLRDRFERKVF